MSERDVMTLLAEANPVRAEELNDLALADSVFARRRPTRRFVLAAAVVASALAAALIGVFAFGGSANHLYRERSAGPPPTLAHPLTHPDAKEVTLSDATQALGAPIVLPNSRLADSSNVGAIWMQKTGPVTDVAVTFPNTGLIVDYERPSPYPEPAPAMYETEARQSPDSMSVIDLNGVPALATAQNSDPLHQNFGAIAFVVNGTVINVMGHYDEATLQSIARAIVDRADRGTQGSSGVIANPMAGSPTMEYPLGKGFGQQVSLADAARALGGPVTLPDTAQVKPSDVGAVQMESGTGDGQKLVDLGISFPKQGMIVQYIQPPIPDPLANYEAAANNSPASLIYLNGGVPAVAVQTQLSDGSPWGFVQFVAGGSTILVMGPDQATLQPAAQSILDRSQP